MNKYNLFLNTLGDIESRLETSDEYEILMISGLLRKLILENDSLVNQINKERKIKIRFLINDKNPPSFMSDLSFWSIEDGIDPDSVPFNNVKEINIEGFLQKQVMLINGQIITVKDLIKHMANVEGAVHPGLPKTDKEKLLKELGETFGIGGLPAGIRLLKAISRVILKGLQPLK